MGSLRPGSVDLMSASPAAASCYGRPGRPAGTALDSSTTGTLLHGGGVVVTGKAFGGPGEVSLARAGCESVCWEECRGEGRVERRQDRELKCRREGCDGCQSREANAARGQTTLFGAGRCYPWSRVHRAIDVLALKVKRVSPRKKSSCAA